MPARERRYILRSLFSPGSVKFWKLKTDCARLIYLALLVHADDNGVVECDHESVNAMAPRNHWTVRERSGAVQALVKSGLGTTYREDGKLYMKITGFAQSQTGQTVRIENEKEQHVSGPRITAPIINTRISSLLNSSNESASVQNQNSELAYHNAKKRFHRIVNKSFGTLGNQKSQWDKLVEREGAEIVVAAVDIWAREKKETLKASKYIPIHTFLKFGSEFIDLAKQEAAPDESGAAVSEDEDSVEADRPPDYEETQRKLAEERARKAKAVA